MALECVRTVAFKPAGSLPNAAEFQPFIERRQPDGLAARRPYAAARQQRANCAGRWASSAGISLHLSIAIGQRALKAQPARQFQQRRRHAGDLRERWPRVFCDGTEPIRPLV